MKVWLYACILLFFVSSHGLAQTTVEKQEKYPYKNLVEKYSVLADSPAIKHGRYTMIYKKNIAIASGSYQSGQQNGTWHFFAPTGKLLQSYNYSNNKLIYEAPEDSTSAIRYVFDDNFTETDSIYKPVKPGGLFFGYLPYLKHFYFPDELRGIDAETPLHAIVELLISPGGRLAEYKIRVLAPQYNYNKVAVMSLNLLDENDKIFIPGRINGTPVQSSIYLSCLINSKGQLEYSR